FIGLIRKSLSSIRQRHAENDAAIIVGLDGGWNVDSCQSNFARVARREVVKSVTDDCVILHFELVTIAEDQHARLLGSAGLSLRSRGDVSGDGATVLSIGILGSGLRRRSSAAGAVFEDGGCGRFLLRLFGGLTVLRILLSSVGSIVRIRVYGHSVGNGVSDKSAGVIEPAVMTVAEILRVKGIARAAYTKGESPGERTATGSGASEAGTDSETWNECWPGRGAKTAAHGETAVHGRSAGRRRHPTTLILRTKKGNDQ